MFEMTKISLGKNSKLPTLSKARKALNVVVWFPWKFYEDDKIEKKKTWKNQANLKKL